MHHVEPGYPFYNEGEHTCSAPSGWRLASFSNITPSF